MKLTGLEATFVSQGERTIAVGFLCPKCRGERIYIGFANPVDGGPPPDDGQAVHWRRSGITLETLSLHPSIDFTHHTETGEKCNWHGWVKDGDAS